MVFAQFYTNDVTGTLTEACGDRAVMRLDGRMSKQHWHDVAAETARRRGYLAYMLCKGESYANANPVTKIILV